MESNRAYRNNMSQSTCSFMVVWRRLIFVRFVWYVPSLPGQLLNSSRYHSKLQSDSSISERDSQHRIISHLSHYNLRHYFWSHHFRYHFDCQFRYILFYFISSAFRELPYSSEQFHDEIVIGLVLECMEIWGPCYGLGG
jgi:hypothetical protein